MSFTPRQYLERLEHLESLLRNCRADSETYEQEREALLRAARRMRDCIADRAPADETRAAIAEYDALAPREVPPGMSRASQTYFRNWQRRVDVEGKRG